MQHSARRQPKVPIFVGVALFFMATVFAGSPADAYWNIRTKSGCDYALEASEYNDSLGRLLAYGNTERWSGSTNCNTVRVKVNGNLFGSAWSLDSGYKFNGAAYSGQWFGQCDSGQHWAAFGGGYWSWTCP